MHGPNGNSQETNHEQIAKPLQVQAWFHRLMQHIDDLDMRFTQAVVDVVLLGLNAEIPLLDFIALAAARGTGGSLTHPLPQHLEGFRFLLLAEMPEV